jgi:ABC-type Mn2+/Zn2+ transport system ATPase subunit
MRTIPILRARPRPSPQSARSTHASVAIEVDGLTVVRGGTVALDSVDLRVHAGELVAVIGPNGSGKSTLLEVASGLLAPTTGTVRVFGRAPRDSHELVAHVMQSTVANAAMPLTVLETVRMGRYARTGAFRPLNTADREAVIDAIERMRLGDLAHRQLQELSGGQRQRTYVAQGLAQQAEILLLDEPGTGLDLVTQETVTAAIRTERAAGRTIVLTTHDVGTARTADRVVLLSTRLVAAGPSDQVLTPEHLEVAYGGHVHLLDDGTIVLDDPHHHGVPGERGR